MTPERAAYHRLMLLAGQTEEYEQELDLALENEDPITVPILDLALCMSDLDQTVSVLYRYTLAHSVDRQQVCGMVLETLRTRYAEGHLDAVRVCGILSCILELCEFGEPWIRLYECVYDYELWQEGVVSREVFETCFESVFLHGQRLDGWAMQKAHNPKKKSIPDFFRKHERKENLP